MPFGNRLGPRGLGPMTGRAAGYCTGYDAPGYMNPGFGFCTGGFGRGYRHWYWETGLPGWARFGAPAPLNREQEVAALEAQAEWLKERLEAIEGRLGVLSKEPKERRIKEAVAILPQAKPCGRMVLVLSVTARGERI